MRNLLSFLLTQLTLFSFAQDGSLDLSFGSGGKAVFPGTISGSSKVSMAVQNDGRVILLARAQENGGRNILLTRFNVNGSPDHSFGTAGRVSTQLTQGMAAGQQIALQKDGKILAGSMAYNSKNDVDFVLVRYNSDGSLDYSFGTNGMVVTDLLGADDYLTGVCVLPDGKIVASGYAQNAGGSDIALVRYMANGALDNSFGQNGVVTTNLGAGESANAMALQGDGKIVIAGYHGYPDYYLLVARYHTDGKIDNSFNGTGFVKTPVPSYTVGYTSVLIQPDAKILATGNMLINGGSPEKVLMRYNANGSYDNTFGNEGMLRFTIENNQYWSGKSVLQTDGKILTVSPGYLSQTSDFHIMRLHPDGTPDLSFGTRGITKVAMGAYSDDSYDIAGFGSKIYIAGKVRQEINGLSELGVARLHNSRPLISVLPKAVPEQGKKIKIYPNPVYNNLLSIVPEEGVSSVSIYNGIGQLVMVAERDFASINISRLISGYYNVVVYFRDGLFAYEPFVKQ